MVIQHSKQLLEQLTEIESRIKKYEEMMDALGIELDREKLLKLLIGQRDQAHWPNKKKQLEQVIYTEAETRFSASLNVKASSGRVTLEVRVAS